MNNPPKIPLKLMQYFLRPEYLEEVQGDLHEVYDELCEQHSIAKAKRIYWKEAIKLCRPALVKKLSGSIKLNSYGMFNLLFKISIRNLLKSRMVSIMSILTLVVGAVSFQLIFSWIHNEESMDEFHENDERIFIGTTRFTSNADLIAGHLQRMYNLDYSEYPEIEKVMSIHNYQPGEIQFISGGKSFEGTALIPDSTFFDLFDFPLLFGNKEALSDPTSILVTEKYARRVWGDENPIGKQVQIKCDQDGNYQVAGILKDVPSNSSIYFDYLIPRHSQRFWRRMPQDLILLTKGADIKGFNAKIQPLVEESRFKESTITFLPFSRIYKDQPFNISLFSKYGNKTNFQVMQIVAVALLLIMIFGFTNIQSTSLMSMTKKLGIKRVIGAQKRELILEIMVNMLLYFLLAVSISFICIQQIFDNYTSQMGLNIDNDPLLNLTMISIVIGLCCLVTILLQFHRIGGINALQALSHKVNFFKASSRQKLATALQYTIAISILIASSLIYLQVRFMLNKETGLNQQNIVQTDFFGIIPSAGQDSLERVRLMNQHSYVMDNLKQNRDIVAFSHGQIPLDYAYGNSWRKIGSSDDFLTIKTMTVDPAYQEVFDLELVHGRFFNDSLDNSGDLKVVINEAAMNQFGIQGINEVKIESNTGANRKYTVIGVVKNFHYEHLSQAIKPLVMPYFYYPDRDLLIRHLPRKKEETITYLKELYQEINSSGFLVATTFEDRVAEQYMMEKNTNKIYLSFGIVALILSCISMFTFTFHETKRRTKEIGIRKVNGATINNIFKLLSRSFLSTIGIAFVISCPIVWYFINEWLGNFANRINIEWWVFVGVGLLVAFLALTVITWHVLKVARLNPVETLRDE